MSNDTVITTFIYIHLSKQFIVIISKLALHFLCITVIKQITLVMLKENVRFRGNIRSNDYTRICPLEHIIHSLTSRLSIVTFT